MTGRDNGPQELSRMALEEAVKELTPDQAETVMKAAGFLAGQPAPDLVSAADIIINGYHAENYQELLSMLSDEEKTTLGAMTRKFYRVMGSHAEQVRIQILGVNPKLNPSSPDFDEEAYREAVQERRENFKGELLGIQETIAHIQELLPTMEELSFINDAAQLMRDIQATVTAFLPEVLEVIIPAMTRIAEDKDFWQRIEKAEEEKRLEKAIEELLEEQGPGGPLADVPIEDILEAGLDPETGEPTHTASGDIIRQALEILETMADEVPEEEGEGEEEGGGHPQKPAPAEPGKFRQVHYQKSSSLQIVTDLFANQFFRAGALAPAPAGTLEKGKKATADALREKGHKLTYTKQGAKKSAMLFWDFAAPANASFGDYEFFVTTALDNLRKDGNSVVSLTKIWRALGNRNNPKKEQCEDLLETLRKGLATPISLDEADVLEAWGAENAVSEGRRHVVSSPAMPVQIDEERFLASGYLAGLTVNIMGYSPFYLLARKLGHIGTWPADILSLYTGRRTQRYYAVMRYLLREIGWMRNGKSKRSNKILFSSLYEYTESETARAQQLTQKMMYRLLDEVFKPSGAIISYKNTPKGTPAGVLIRFKKAGK